MRQLIFISTFLFLHLLVGCDKSDKENTPVNATVTNASVFTVNTDNTLVQKTLPTIRQLCPGLDKYAGEFSDINVDDGYYFRTTLKFHIDENAKIPNEYAAQGNNCFIDINDDSTVTIHKSACQSVCLDHESSHDELMFNLPKTTDTSSTNKSVTNISNTTHDNIKEGWEILPPTPDNKPPRAGCLMVFKPDDTTEWSCPIL